MEADKTGQQQQQPSPPGADRDPVARGANTLDRYSLMLQLIQVYPIIVGCVAVVLPITWLRILIAMLGLLSGTLWAVLRERSIDRGAGRAALKTSAAAGPGPVTTTSEVAGIRVDIWLHPDGGTPLPSRPHRAYQRPITRPITPRVHHRTVPLQTPRHHTTEDSEPAEGSGHVITAHARTRARR